MPIWHRFSGGWQCTPVRGVHCSGVGLPFRILYFLTLRQRNRLQRAARSTKLRASDGTPNECDTWGTTQITLVFKLLQLYFITQRQVRFARLSKSRGPPIRGTTGRASLGWPMCVGQQTDKLPLPLLNSETNSCDDFLNFSTTNHRASTCLFIATLISFFRLFCGS